MTPMHDSNPSLTHGSARRTLLRASTAGALSLCGAALGLPAVAATPAAVDRIALLNTHTGERLNLPYREHGQVVAESQRAVEHLLRDHRNDEQHPIDPLLIDQLLALRRQFALAAPFHVVSGYRSPQTNARLAAASGGVARNSLHLQGRAIDIRVPGLELRTLRQAALALGRGGVGYYARSDFVHLDSGRRRHW